MRSMLLEFALLCSIQLCFANTNLDINDEAGKQVAVSSSDFNKQKVVSEHVLEDKGQASKEDATKIVKSEKENHNEKQENGYYDEKDIKQSGHEIGKNQIGQSQAYDTGKNAYEKHNSGQERKGYHRSGFVNNYHKDESGNNSSYYEDSSDEKGHLSHDSKDQYYGKKEDDSYKNRRYDNALLAYDKANQGRYGKGERYNDQYGYQNNYNGNAHDNVQRNYLRDGAEKYSDRNGNGNYYRQEYQPRHHPYDYPNHYPPVGPYPLDYYQQSQAYTYPNSYYHPVLEYNRGDSHHPDQERYYSKSYGNYYSKENSDHSDLYFRQYLPNRQYHEEYIQIY